MVGPSSVTVLAERSAQPVVSSVEATVAACAGVPVATAKPSTRISVARNRRIDAVDTVDLLRAGRPGNLRGVVVVDAHHPPARALGAEASLERRPVVRADRRPAELGDRWQPR